MPDIFFEMHAQIIINTCNKYDYFFKKKERKQYEKYT